MSDDPFDDIDPDAYRDREGDPFEHLDGANPVENDDPDRVAEGDAWEAGDTGDTWEAEDTGDTWEAGDTGDTWEAEDEDRSEPVSGGTDRAVDVSGDAFGDVDGSRGDPFESADSPFRQVDVDSVDPDEVWERFTGETERVEQTQSETVGGESVPEDATEVVEVPKGRFCQTCPHFSAPPETACSHPGTEVLTFVGTDEVRVSNCPVVRERRELGETYD